MSQSLHTHSISETYYIVILLLVAYVMSSAPRYVREYRNQPEKTLSVPAAPMQEWKKVLKAYSIQPYINAWQQLRPTTEMASLLR